ncbi:MAG: ferrochelatase [Pirellulaceae bacterium]|jgi:ferrochelatase|nr:ferrochelatase [Pirellulaceae bacterium]
MAEKDSRPPRSHTYDAILFVSFGGPESPDDVIPFLENVLRGKNVPHARMLEVAEHYRQLGGVSPINEQCRTLIASLKAELAEHGHALPVYWGNRNWHPMLAEALLQMRSDGVQHALAFMTSAFSSYSGCRQYREDIACAQVSVGEGAPKVDKLRVFFNHPGYIDPMRERIQRAIDQMAVSRRAATHIVFTAHSIPVAMARGCAYEEQLRESCRLVAEAFPDQSWELAFQSRSGPPSMPWLEPDILDCLRKLHADKQITDVVIAPIGFISDHLEVLFDLDTEAAALCAELGLNMVRAATVGTHPRFVSMIRELIDERIKGTGKKCLGRLGPYHDICPPDCCLSGRPPTTSH